MRTVEYRRLLDDRNAVRVRFELERHQILKFVVQLECRFNDEWMAVVRYDTTHNFAHCDVLHPTEKAQKVEMASQDYNEALTLAIDDLTKNWQKYRRRYERWLKQK